MGSNQDTHALGAEGFQFVVTAVLIAQEKAQFGGKLPNERGRLFVIGRIGWGHARRQAGQVGRQRDPHRPGTDEVRFPAVYPAMPARFGPSGFGINRRMRYDARLAVGLVPDPTVGAQHRAFDGGGSATPQPGLDPVDQIAPQTTDLPWQRTGNGRQTPLPGAPVRAVPLFIGQELAQGLQEQLGVTYLFIAHNLSMVNHISPVVAVMYLGKIMERATCRRLFEDPCHPYTQSINSAAPIPSPKMERKRQRVILKGEPPSPAKSPAGCVFHPRCPVSCQQERDKSGLPVKAHFFGLDGHAADSSICVCCDAAPPAFCV